MWDELVQRLRPVARIVRYDNRGHGRSDAPMAPLTLERLGRDVLAVMDHLQIERAVFCGLSLGGLIGMWLGANAPGALGWSDPRKYRGEFPACGSVDGAGGAVRSVGNGTAGRADPGALVHEGDSGRRRPSGWPRSAETLLATSVGGLRVLLRGARPIGHAVRPKSHNLPGSCHSGRARSVNPAEPRERDRRTDRRRRYDHTRRGASFLHRSRRRVRGQRCRISRARSKK